MCGCGKEEAPTALDPNEAVALAQNLANDGFDGMTYGTALAYFVPDGVWSYFQDEEGNDIVALSGTCTYQEAPVKAEVSFAITDGVASLLYVTVNDVVLEDTPAEDFINAAFGACVAANQAAEAEAAAAAEAEAATAAKTTEKSAAESGGSPYDVPDDELEANDYGFYSDPPEDDYEEYSDPPEDY